MRSRLEALPAEGKALRAPHRAWPAWTCPRFAASWISSQTGASRSQPLVVHIGTVHAYHGKEQAAIVLALGGNVNAEGPLNWAARRPNLLKVALTRAQRRIDVVGNRERWQRRPHFRQLSRILTIGIDLAQAASRPPSALLPRREARP